MLFDLVKSQSQLRIRDEDSSEQIPHLFGYEFIILGLTLVDVLVDLLSILSLKRCLA